MRSSKRPLGGSMRMVAEAPECSGRAGVACVTEDMRFEISSPKRKWLAPLRVSEMRRGGERGTQRSRAKPAATKTRRVRLYLGRRIFLELLDIAVFDLLHEGFAAEKIELQIRGEPAGHDEKLIVDDFGKRNGTARRNKMRAPLKN